MSRATPISVEELMTTPVRTVLPADSIARAREEMEIAEVHHIPVVDEARRLLGMISQRDVAGSAGNGFDLETPVANIMRKPVWTAHPHTPAAAAVAALIDHRIGSLPVIDEHHRLVGIVTATDFLELVRDFLTGRLPEAAPPMPILRD